MSGVHPELHFGLFHRKAYGFSRLTGPRMQRRIYFEPRLAGFFLCLNNIFNLLVPPRGYRFAAIRQTRRLRSHT